MKTAAIICEFNPLHSGHKRLIDFAHTVADKVVCVMSGNFTQRGMPACADKYSRAKHALLAGADAVIELPTIYATASAENFAYGAISIVAAINADLLVFGSECGDLDSLTSCADMLCDAAVNDRIRKEIHNGVSYPKAVALATGTKLLDAPNNTLAIEYLKALKNHPHIQPITIKRENNHSIDLAGEFASSKMLRADKALRNKYSYDYVTSDIDDEIETRYKQVATSVLALAEKEQLKNIEGMTEGLHNRVYNADKSGGFDEMLDSIKTKRYTRMKLQRAVLCSVLGITKRAAAAAKSEPPTIQILAVKKDFATAMQWERGDADEITRRADRLYASIGGKLPPRKLLKL